MKLIIIILLIFIFAITLTACAELDVVCNGDDCSPLAQEDRVSINRDIYNETHNLQPVT